MFEIKDTVNLFFSHFKNTVRRNLDVSSLCGMWLKKVLYKGNRTYVLYFGMYLLCLLQGYT